MRFTHLRLENYRAFHGRHELALRPLTLLYGYNHSGKSALLRALALLAESASERNSGPLSLSGEAARGAGWEDIKSRQASARAPLGFELLGSSGEDGEARPFSLSLQFDHEVEQRRIYTRGLNLSWGADRRLSADFQLITGRGSARLLAQSARLEAPELARGLLTLPLAMGASAITPDPTSALEVVSRLSQPALGPTLQLLTLPASILKDLDGVTQWLGSVRARPPRRFAFPGAPPAKMDQDGNGAVAILAHDRLALGSLDRRVKEFYQRIASPGRFQLEVMERASEVRVVLRPAENPGVEVDLVDAGEGLAQVFPVLVALARAERGERGDPTLLLLEQPELHLHPRAEQLLGATLCEVVERQPEARLIVETHSEVLLLSVFEAILEGRIAPEAVGLNWIRQNGQGDSSIEPVELDALARPGEAWPPNAFDEIGALAARVVRLRRERSRA